MAYSLELKGLEFRVWGFQCFEGLGFRSFLGLGFRCFRDY